MKSSTTFFISCITAAIAIFIYAIHQEWIIIRFWQPTTVLVTGTTYTKKKINLYFWHHDRWNKESQDILWTDDDATNQETIIHLWLALLDTERITPKKVSLQTAIIAPNKHDLLISFDRSLFAKSWSIHQKLMVIESLFKTVAEQQFSVTAIQLLIDHQPIIDTHLDLSFPWPLSGFLE